MTSQDDELANINRESTRRRLLQVVGSIGLLGTAGCLGGTLSDGSDATPTESDGSTSSTTKPNESSSSTGTIRDIGEGTVTDANGRTVELSDRIEEVVAVGPGALNLVAYLDATDMVVGVEESEHSWGTDIPYNVANPHLRDLPVVGPHKGGDPELIVDADPDVVVATYFTAGSADDLQRKIDRPVVVVKAQSRPLHRLQKAYDDLRFLAGIVGKEDRAETVIDFFESERTALEERATAVPDGERRDVYFAGRSDSGGAGATSTQYPFAPFSFVNAANVADSISGHATVNEEKLLTWDPSAVFVSGSNRDRVTDAFSAGQYSSLRAVEEGNLYTLLPTRFYGNLYGNVLADAYYVGSVLYPEAFSDVDPVSRTGDIYETLFETDVEVYDELADSFGGFGHIEL
ncbi:MAG: iron complex transport system substrate-binding protein [Halobacteriales archaeon]|jgi:iron complex transport system substrate-binding protein